MPPAKSLPAISRIEFYCTNDEALACAAAHAIDSLLDKKSPPKLTAKHQAIRAWGRLQIDVENGGFEQFFLNAGGNTGVSGAANLVEELGFPKVAATLHEADAVFKRNKMLFRSGDPDNVYGKVPEFDPLSRRFVQTVISPSRAVGKWLRLHVSELFVGDDGQPIDAKLTGTVSIESRGRVVESLEVRRGKAHGVHRRFLADGSQREAFFYVNGEKSGNFWPNGQVRFAERKEGTNRITEWFYPSGAIHKRMVEDKARNEIEPARLYYENGQLEEELHLRRGQEFGPWKKWFEDGSPKLEAEYREGNKLVVHNAWDDDRRQVVKNGRGVFRDDGRRINNPVELFSRSRVVDENELKDGLPHGRWTRWSEGTLNNIGEYKGGVLHGELTTFWDNGRKHLVSHYVNGEQISCEKFPRLDNPVPAPK
jgi:antitoxin component YwqK of YwqJK toxin-antitoxin module